MMWVKCFVRGFMAALWIVALILPGGWSTTLTGRYGPRASRPGGRMRASSAGLPRWVVTLKDRERCEVMKGTERQMGETLTKLQGQ